MKYLSEYRQPEAVQRCAAAIHRRVTRPWNLMEICGGQTHTIMRFGLDAMLPAQVRMIHGPGCPVCVTPVEMLDKAIRIASFPEVIFCSYGDMLRVPGSERDLLAVKAAGGDVRVVYSPLDAVQLAERHPERQVVFFAIGFETTAPANAMAVLHAERLGLANFFCLVSHVLVPPAMQAVLSSPRNLVHGFLAAGHVCAVMGTRQYEPIVRQFHTPVVVTGFEPLDLLQGISMCLAQLEQGRAELEIQYRRVVRPEGNRVAQEQLQRVFTTVTRKWRGIGEIPASGWALSEAYARFDAEQRFDVGDVVADESQECLAGEVLQGHRKPLECAAFGTRCTPEHPLGAPMVSGEGACAAYYRYRRQSV